LRTTPFEIFYKAILPQPIDTTKGYNECTMYYNKAIQHLIKRKHNTRDYTQNTEQWSFAKHQPHQFTISILHQDFNGN
jgi:hypothetical protein